MPLNLKIKRLQKNEGYGNEGNEAGMDNRQAMARSVVDRLVGRPKEREGIYRTVASSNSAGGTGAILSIEEREELESRGINPDWERAVFKNDLKKEAIQNRVWLEKSYFDDKKLIHDQKASGTSENDVYVNSDGKRQKFVFY